MIQTSRLTEKLDLLQLTSSATTYGTTVPFWKTVGTIFGSILVERGQKSYDQLPGAIYETDIRFYLRYNPVLDKKMYRIGYQGHIYKIVEIATVQRNQATIISIELFQ